MQSWERRPIEEANLLNPAFCSLLIARSVEGYVETADRGLPFPISFIVLPILLHQDTRRSLPRSVATTMLGWIETNQTQLVGFADRVRRVRPYTQEALHFGLLHSVLALNG